MNLSQDGAKDTSKRSHEFSEEGCPFKKRRVHFSEISCVRTIECSNIDSISESLGSCNDGGCEAAPFTHDSTKEIDTTVATKNRDGPSIATLTTQRLFRILKETKKLNRVQVDDLLREATKTSPDSAHSSSANGDHIDSDETSVQNECKAVSEQVLERLRSLDSRIEMRGKASLLPCTSNLGRPFLPAIRFLIKCLLVRMDPTVSVMAQG